MHFFFSGNVSTGAVLAINFDLVKCTTKRNINRYQNYNRKVEGGLSPERLNIGIRCTSMVYSRELK